MDKITNTLKLYKEYINEHPNYIGVLSFWLKSSLALIFACWIAFEFETPEAAWAVICATILVHPDSGAVLSKSIARIIGTIIGASFAVILFYLFPQAPWIFLFFLGIWVGLCSLYSAYTKDFSTYAVALSGFMPAMIFMTAVEYNMIEDVVRIASVRACTISLGIICVALVFGLTHIRSGYKGFIKNVYGLRNYSAQILRLKLQNQNNIETIRKFANYSESLKRQLKYASVEDPEVTMRAKAIISLTNDVFCAAVDLDNYLDVLIKQNLITKEDLHSFEKFLDILELPIGEANLALENFLANPQIKSEGLRRRAMMLTKFYIYMQKEFTDTPMSIVPRKMGVFVDELITTKMVIGAFIVTLSSGAIWILSEWPLGPFFVTFSISAYLLQSTKDNYGKESLYFFFGSILSFIPAFIAQQIFMPIMYGFVWFSFWLSLAIFPGVYLKYSKKYSTVGISLLLFTVILISPTNVMNYDFQNFLNTYVASILACGLGSLVIIITMPWNPKHKIERMIKSGQEIVSILPFIHDEKGDIGKRLDIEQDRYELLVRFYNNNLVPKEDKIDKQFLTVISLIRIFETENSQISELIDKKPDLMKELATLWSNFNKLDDKLSDLLLDKLKELKINNENDNEELIFLEETCKKLLGKESTC